MVDFTSILGKKAADVEKPKPRPPGTYLAAINGMAKQREVKTKDGDRAVLAFSCKLLAPREDVDQERFAEATAKGDVSSWPAMDTDIFIDGEQGEWQLRRFLVDTLGIEPGDKSLGEMVAESPGRQLLVTVVNEPYQDKNTGQMEIATRLRGTAKV